MVVHMSIFIHRCGIRIPHIVSYNILKQLTILYIVLSDNTKSISIHKLGDIQVRIILACERTGNIMTVYFVSFC